MQKNAIKIIKRLQDEGYEAYFAGGSVRDLILGKDPKDIDIATSANVDQIQKLFPDNIAVGKQFGVILVRSEDHNYEVATFREEGPYLDGRRPSFVNFSSAEDDAKRRDLTINGLFYDPIHKKILDYIGGQDDIENKIIRFIGNPDERIKEDNLRLLRAIRFKTTLDFSYSSGTFKAIKKNSELIKNVAVERVREEINQIFKCGLRSEGLDDLVLSGITTYLVPEIDALKGVAQPKEYHHEGDVYTHTYLAVKSLPQHSPSYLVWAVLLHDIGKPNTFSKQNDRIIFHDHAQFSAVLAEKILRRLKFPNYEIETICWLVGNHMKIVQIPQMRPVKQMNLLLDHRFPDLIKLCEADARGTYPINLSMIRQMQHELEEAKSRAGEMEKIKIKTKLFTGDDLIKLGLSPSHLFKDILDDVNDRIITGRITTKEQVKKYVTDNYIQK